MTVSQIDNLYDALTLVSLDFDIWSGQTRLINSDIKLGVGGELPPDRLAMLGSKRVIATSCLASFQRLKSEARRRLEAVGVTFMGGYAIPTSRADEVVKELDRIRAEYKSEKAAFLASYESNVEVWVSQNRKYESAIREGALTVEEVERRIDFKYAVFNITPPRDPDLAVRLNEKVIEVGNTLMDDVCATAEAMFVRAFEGRDRINKNVRRTLQKIHDKVFGLTFLNGDLVRLTDMLRLTIAGIDQYDGSREVSAAFSAQLVGIVAVLRDPQLLRDFVDGKFDLDVQADDTDLQNSSVVKTAEGSDHANQRSSVISSESNFSTTQTLIDQSSVKEDRDDDDGQLGDLSAFFGSNGSMQASEEEQSLQSSDAVETVESVKSDDAELTVDDGGSWF